MTQNGRNTDILITIIKYHNILIYNKFICISTYSIVTFWITYMTIFMMRIIRHILTEYYNYLLAENLCTSATIGYCVPNIFFISITHILKLGYKITITFNKLITHQILQFILHFHILPNSSSLR